jgi:hypothetical protein
MRDVIGWIVINAAIAAALIGGGVIWWNGRKRRKARERITRGFNAPMPTPLKNRALEAANRTAKPK